MKGAQIPRGGMDSVRRKVNNPPGDNYPGESRGPGPYVGPGPWAPAALWVARSAIYACCHPVLGPKAQGRRATLVAIPCHLQRYAYTGHLQRCAAGCAKRNLHLSSCSVKERFGLGGWVGRFHARVRKFARGGVDFASTTAILLYLDLHDIGSGTGSCRHWEPGLVLPRDPSVLPRQPSACSRQSSDCSRQPADCSRQPSDCS